ncbi:MAG: metalloregulator ArsR/SmtB family transcription factor, partial [Spirochaetota bacterium]
GDRSVGDLVTGTGGSISAISQQLKLLTLGGLIERRRNGRNIYYSLKGPDAGKVLESILGFCMDYTRQHPESARQVLAEGAEKDPQEPFTAR